MTPELEPEGFDPPRLGPRHPRIGVAFAGEARSRRSWSGIPAGLVSGLESCGVGLAEINAELPAPLRALTVNGLALAAALGSGWETFSDPVSALRGARRQVRASPTIANLRSRVANRRLGRAPELDALIQIHAEFQTRAAVPLATYEDLTVHQALRHGYTELAGLSPSDQRRRIAIQHDMYQRARACCVTTHWVKDSIVDDYGIGPGKVHVVGIAAERRRDPANEAPVERDWSVPRFLFVGWDWRRKNGDRLLRVFGQVREQVPAAELDLVGGHPQVEADGVTAHGPLHLDVPAERQQVNDLYGRATCYVMPSLVEPSAIAYLEAASFGLPAIGTTVGGSRELIGDGGLVVDPHDEHAMYAAMLELCTPERAAELGTKAAKRAELYTWTAVASRILTALEVDGFDSAFL